MLLHISESAASDSPACWLYCPVLLEEESLADSSGTKKGDETRETWLCFVPSALFEQADLIDGLIFPRSGMLKEFVGIQLALQMSVNVSSDFWFWCERQGVAPNQGLNAEKVTDNQGSDDTTKQRVCCFQRQDILIRTRQA